MQSRWIAAVLLAATVGFTAPSSAQTPGAGAGAGPRVVGDCSPRADDYPAAARRAGAGGRVQLMLAIEPGGAVGTVTVVQSSGDTREHKLLDRVSIDVARRCRFEPGAEGEKRTSTMDMVWSIR